MCTVIYWAQAIVVKSLKFWCLVMQFTHYKVRVTEFSIYWCLLDLKTLIPTIPNAHIEETGFMNIVSILKLNMNKMVLCPAE